VAAALPTDAVTTYPQVLDLATVSGVPDPALHELAVDAIVNRWSDDDPRWSLLPVTPDGPSSVPLRVRPRRAFSHERIYFVVRRVEHGLFVGALELPHAWYRDGQPADGVRALGGGMWCRGGSVVG
jgi:hypothetical protein